MIDAPQLFTTLSDYTVSLSSAVYLLVNIVEAALILTLNGLVLDTMVRQGKSREAADLLVAGLALTDFLMGVFLVWVTVYNMVGFQTIYECLARLGLANSMMLTGVLLLFCLTVECYFKIVIPFTYEDICKKWTVWVVMATAFMVGIYFGSLPTFGWNTASVKNSEEHQCRFFNIMDGNFLRLFMVLVMTMILLMFLLHTKLFVVANEHAASFPLKQSNNKQVERMRANFEHAWEYSKTVLHLVGINFVLWLPMGIVVACCFTGAFDDMSAETKSELMLYTSTIKNFNSLLNPLIYASKIPVIKTRFQKIYYCCFKKRETIVSTHYFQPAVPYTTDAKVVAPNIPKKMTQQSSQKPLRPALKQASSPVAVKAIDLKVEKKKSKKKSLSSWV